VSQDPIARHIALLGAELSGPWRVKKDLLREARHGLIDCAEAYRDEGLSEGEAARRAVAEFGEPAEVAGEYQAELAARQTFTALAFVAAFGPVSEVFTRVMWSHSPAPHVHPREFAFLLSRIVDWVGWGNSIVAVVLILSVGLQARWTTFRGTVARAVGVGLMVVVVFHIVTGIALTAMYHDPEPAGSWRFMDIASNMIYPVATAYAVWLAMRCLAVAQRVERLAL
jgi:hypothetical protein